MYELPQHCFSVITLAAYLTEFTEYLLKKQLIYTQDTHTLLLQYVDESHVAKMLIYILFVEEKPPQIKMGKVV